MTARTREGEAAHLVDAPVEVRRLREIEAARVPFDVTIDGWSAWAIVRPHVISRLANLPLAAATRVPMADRARRALGDLVRAATAGRRRVLLKTYASGLVEADGDRFRDVWFDDLALDIGDVYKVEAVNNPLFAERSRRALLSRAITNEAVDGFLPGAVGRLAGAPGVAEAARALVERMRGEPELAGLDEPFLRRVLAAFHWSTRAWGALLARVQPSVVLTADPFEASLTAAARRRGIPVVELQHGLNDPAHHAAYAWGPEARPFRDRLPLPDRLFLYGEHWRSRLASAGFWDDELTSVGSARMDRYRALAIPRPTDHGVIVVTTQGLDVPRLVAFLGEWLRSAGDQNVELVLKLHPAYETDRASYAPLATDRRVRVLLGAEEPSTLRLIAGAHLHLSISSTCHYEALALGTPTAVLPLATHEIMRPLVAAGHAYLPADPAALAALTAEWGQLRLLPGVGDHYFSAGATASMRRELAALAGGAGSRTLDAGL